MRRKGRNKIVKTIKKSLFLDGIHLRYQDSKFSSRLPLSGRPQRASAMPFPSVIPRSGFVSIAPLSRYPTRSYRSPQRRIETAYAASRPSTITFRGRTIAVPRGTNLRRALLDADLSPHNGRASLINCRGLGTCGTCAVVASPGLEPAEASLRERARLAFPPHDADVSRKRSLRLACQVRVVGDVDLRKNAGFWGQYEEEKEW